MTAIIARHNGDFMIKSTETGQLALITAEEWAALVRRIKSGHLDYTLPQGRPWADVLAEQVADIAVCAIRYAHSAHNSPGFADCAGVDR